MSHDFDGDSIAILAKNAFIAGYYTHTANIEASDLEDVFKIGNVGPETSIERLGNMFSVSVGTFGFSGTGVSGSVL